MPCAALFSRALIESSCAWVPDDGASFFVRQATSARDTRSSHGLMATMISRHPLGDNAVDGDLGNRLPAVHAGALNLDVATQRVAFLREADAVAVGNRGRPASQRRRLRLPRDGALSRVAGVGIGDDVEWAEGVRQR